MRSSLRVERCAATRQARGPNVRRAALTRSKRGSRVRFRARAVVGRNRRRERPLLRTRDWSRGCSETIQPIALLRSLRSQTSSFRRNRADSRIRIRGPDSPTIPDGYILEPYGYILRSVGAIRIHMDVHRIHTDPYGCPSGPYGSIRMSVGSIQMSVGPIRIHTDVRMDPGAVLGHTHDQVWAPGGWG